MLKKMLLILVGLVMLAAGVTAPASADLSQLPQGTRQLITVTSTKAENVDGMLTAWERDDRGVWSQVIAPVAVKFGSLGLGEPADDVWRTPAGLFALDEAFGRKPNPGTRMPYFQADRMDWWDANPSSPTYNTHVRQEQSPGGDSENLYDMGPVYDYAINIAHNPERIPGRAAAIFLHVTDGQPTWGCVATSEEAMLNLLRWLDPVKRPMISLQVAAPAH